MKLSNKPKIIMMVSNYHPAKLLVLLLLHLYFYQSFYEVLVNIP